MRPRRQSPFRLNAPRMTSLYDEGLRASRNPHQHHESKVKSDKRRHQNTSVDSRRTNFARLASDGSIYDVVMPAASESTQLDESFRGSEEKRHVRPLKEFKNTRQGLRNGLLQSSTLSSEKFLDSSSLSFFKNHEAKAPYIGQSGASHHEDLSRKYTTYPQLRFKDGSADVVYVTGSILSFSILKERVSAKKSNNKIKKGQSIVIPEELRNSSNNVSDALKSACNKNYRTQQFARFNLANSAA